MNIQVNVTTKYTSVWKTCVLLKNKKAKKKKKGNKLCHPSISEFQPDQSHAFAF